MTLIRTSAKLLNSLLLPLKPLPPWAMLRLRLIDCAAGEVPMSRAVV